MSFSIFIEDQKYGQTKYLQKYISAAAFIPAQFGQFSSGNDTSISEDEIQTVAEISAWTVVRVGIWSLHTALLVVVC